MCCLLSWYDTYLRIASLSFIQQFYTIRPTEVRTGGNTPIIPI